MGRVIAVLLHGVHCKGRGRISSEFGPAFSNANSTWRFVDNYAINTERVFITGNLASCR